MPDSTPMQALASFINRTMIPKLPRPIWSLYEGQLVTRISRTLAITHPDDAGEIRKAISELMSLVSERQMFVSVFRAESLGAGVFGITVSGWAPVKNLKNITSPYRWRVDGKPLGRWLLHRLACQMLARYCTPVA